MLYKKLTANPETGHFSLVAVPTPRRCNALHLRGVNAVASHNDILGDFQVKALIVNPFGIGDVLFTTPVIKSLARKGHSVYFWSNERTAEILRHNPAVKGILPLSRGDLKKAFSVSIKQGMREFFAMVKWIKNGRFDMALDFSMDYRYSLMLWLFGVKKRIGFDYKGRGRFLTEAIKIDGFIGKYMAEHYAELLRAADTLDSAKPEDGAAPSASNGDRPLETVGKMELFVGEDDDKWADGFLKENGIGENDVLAGVAPGGGASWGSDSFRKHWPKENFAAVADKLISERGYKVVMFGGENESMLCESVAGKMKYVPVNTGGRLSLGQFAALLKKCKLLITNDGGPLHMAAALGLKTISIFGPVDEKVYGPYPPSPDHIVITGAVDCRPCYKNFRYPLCENIICLDSIDPVRVLEAADKLTQAIKPSSLNES